MSESDNSQRRGSSGFRQAAPIIEWHHTITQKEWDEYQDLKRRAAEYDKATGQPDCVKPEAQRWEEAVEKILRDKGLIA